MGISHAKQYIGKTCDVRWLDRLGRENCTVTKIHDVTYVPLYGGYLVTDVEDIRLDKVVDVYVREAEMSLPLAA